MSVCLSVCVCVRVICRAMLVFGPVHTYAYVRNKKEHRERVDGRMNEENQVE